ncbi:MAG: DUF1150 family protein [Alphaproteobacteria bacterium]|nr:DUF1150 family protein [Alphaproteobacteria bacterium]
MTSIQERLKHLSASDLAMLGLNDIAYVKPIIINDQLVFSIHSADGNQIGMAPDRNTAFAGIRQHELEPLSVH